MTRTLFKLLLQKAVAGEHRQVLVVEAEALPLPALAQQNILAVMEAMEALEDILLVAEEERQAQQAMVPPAAVLLIMPGAVAAVAVVAMAVAARGAMAQIKLV